MKARDSGDSDSPIAARAARTGPVTTAVRFGPDRCRLNGHVSAVDLDRISRRRFRGIVEPGKPLFPGIAVQFLDQSAQDRVLAATIDFTELVEEFGIGQLDSWLLLGADATTYFENEFDHRSGVVHSLFPCEGPALTEPLSLRDCKACACRAIEYLGHNWPFVNRNESFR
jgi:hypothetical protein